MGAGDGADPVLGGCHRRGYGVRVEHGDTGTRSDEIAVVFRAWFNQTDLRIGPVMQVMYAFGALQD